MKKKRFSPSDREVLARLVEKYSAAAVVKTAMKVSSPTENRKGRPANYRTNLGAVYAYVEFYRKQKNIGGKKLGVDATCKRLWDNLENIKDDPIALTPSIGRLRSMYYEAQALAHSDAILREGMRDWLANYTSGAMADGSFPMLLKRSKDVPPMSKNERDWLLEICAAVERDRSKITQ
jgi:hypothetical protein